MSSFRNITTTQVFLIGLLAIWTVACSAFKPSDSSLNRGLATENPGGTASLASVEVPIYQTPQATTAGAAWIRQSIFVQVGSGSATEALLDTGSVGLRVLRSALTPGTYTDTGVAISAGFAAGSTTGTVGMAIVKVGSMATAVAIPFEIIDQVSCGGSVCPFPNDSFFGSGTKGQFVALIGTSLKGDTLPNPLTQMGSHLWTVKLPLPTDVAPGQLTLNLDNAVSNGFTLFQLARQTTPNGLWADNQIPSCLYLNGNQHSCKGASIDTGGFNVRDILIAGASNSQGQAVTGVQSDIEFTNQSGAVVRVDFTVGSGQGTKIFLATDQTQVRNLNTGPLPLWTYTMLFDSDNGRIGFGARQ